jgi:hypothetical protein
VYAYFESLKIDDTHICPLLFFLFVQELPPLRAINYQALCLALYVTYDKYFSIPSSPIVKSLKVDHRLPLYRAVVARLVPELGGGRMPRFIIDL